MCTVPANDFLHDDYAKQPNKKAIIEATEEKPFLNLYNNI